MGPLCRYCGKPIPKATTSVVMGCSPREAARGQGRTERPASKAEAQALFGNHVVTSVEYGTRARIDGDGGSQTVAAPRFVCKVGLWDGVSYEDDLFDSGKCAQAYGRRAAQRDAR